MPNNKQKEEVKCKHRKTENGDAVYLCKLCECWAPIEDDELKEVKHACEVSPTNPNIKTANFCYACANSIGQSKPESMVTTLEEDRKLLEGFRHGSEKQEYINQLLVAKEHLVRAECAEKLRSMLEENLKTEEYFGVYGTVNNKQFIEDFKNS